MKFGTIFALSSAGLAFAAPAAACWDGYMYATARVYLVQLVSCSGEDGCPNFDWTPAKARKAGRGLAELEALLPPGSKLTAHGGAPLTLEIARRRGPALVYEGRWDDGRFDSAVRFVRTSLGLPARGTTRPAASVPMTVQVAALASARRADELVAELHKKVSEENAGYMTLTSDFPSFAFAEPSIDDQGKRVHRVVLGAFLDRKQAERAKIAIARATGHRGMIRPL